VPDERPIERVLRLLADRPGAAAPRRLGKDWRCTCPAHDDGSPSLDVAEGDDGRVLFQCRSGGCQYHQIAAALGLTPADLYVSQQAYARTSTPDRVSRTYDYRDEAGALLFQSVRLVLPGGKKDFRQRRPDPAADGGWAWNLQGVRRVPYRLPGLLAAPKDATLWVVEGEKDADALHALGLVATTNPMGAGKWGLLEQTTVGRVFANRRVVVLPDNDEPGRKHAAEVARQLKPMAASVAVVELPGLPDKGDVYDWLAAGGTKERLLELAAGKLPADPLAWPDPVPLDAATLDPVPEFPGVFAPALADFACAVAEAKNVPADYPAVHLLGAAAGLIGATLALGLADGWVEYPALYTCVVAPKSSRKTPALQAVMRPIRREQARRTHRNEEGVLYTSDPTVEGLAPVLGRQPRGILVARDELTGWALSMNQYKNGGKGADRQFWLEVWAQEDQLILRKNKEAPKLHLRHPCVSTVGSIQPAVFADLAGRDDGFLERFVASYPDPRPMARANRTVFDARHWEAVVGTLAAREMVQEDYGPRPYLVKVGDAAWECFADWTEELAREVVRPDRDPALDGLLGKMPGTAARLALTLYAANRVSGSASIDGDLPVADMERGILLARYFLAHAARVYGLAAADARLPAARRVLAWVGRSGRPEVTRRDVFRGLQRQFAKSEDLRDPLKLLVNHGYLRFAPDRREDQAVYLVHPKLAAGQLAGLSALSTPVSAPR
jgi:hypothetical protein